MLSLQLREGPYILPPILEGEDVYSALSRAYTYSGESNPETFNMKAFGKSFINPVFFGDLACFTEPEKALGCTAIPYYLCTLDSDMQERVVSKILAGEKVGRDFNLNSFRGCRQDHVQYCPECVCEDYEFFGVATIKSIHLVGGINHCPVHGARLLKVPSDSQYEIVPKVEVKKLNRCSEGEMKAIGMLPRFTGITREQVATAIRHRLLDEGVMTPDSAQKVFDKERIFGRLTDVVGRDFFEANRICLTTKAKWLRNMFTRGKVLPVPYYLAMMAAYDITPEEVRETEPDGNVFELPKFSRMPVAERKTVAEKKKEQGDIRDVAMRELLETAYPKMCELDEKITTKWFCRTLNREKIGSMKRDYPETYSFIKEHVEDSEGFFERRSRLFIKNFIPDGRTTLLEAYCRRFGSGSREIEMFRKVTQGEAVNA